MKTWKSVLIVACSVVLSPTLPLRAHCDALDGPVVTEARQALRDGDVQSLLKWVSPEREQEIKGAFAKATAVAEESAAARELAELWFLETLVRVHREGEGAPFTGLKPAGTINPAVQLADRALEDGSVDTLADRVGETVSAHIRARFHEAAERRKSAAESPEAGRAFVESYVNYVHLLESIHRIVQHQHH